MRLKPAEEQVVVLCGASSGIGREAALQFARRGAKVVVAARSEAGLESLVAEIRQDGGEALAVPTDVTEFHQVKALADRAVEVYGHLDTWVHLAAVSIYATFEETDPEEFKQIIDVNLTGQAFGAMAALPYLKRQGGGALICVSSIEARRSFPYQSAYAASKHGVEGMVEALRMELEHEGLPISVTNIMPAAINTPFFNKARTKLGVKPKGVPPFYQPKIVADAILYAAEHPTRDLFVGGVGKLLDLGQKLSPRLMDHLLGVFSFKMQKTDQPKGVVDANNLFRPLDTFNYSEGDFSHLAFKHSTYNAIKQSQTAKTIVLGSLLGAAGVLAFRAFRKS
jgi:NAD(P)-dependent dehydrogenase (short-subunit alcohol dehydrogenase family)